MERAFKMAINISKINNLEPKHLAGKRRFSGIDRETITINGDDAEVVTFILDGITCQIQEDPSDGYRSSAGPITVVEDKVKNTFAAVEVMATHRSGGRNETDDILELRRVKDAAIILEIGTSNLDDYYPSYVCNYTPEFLGTVGE